MMEHLTDIVFVMLMVTASLRAEIKIKSHQEVFEPEWFPGDVMGSIEHSDIEKALKDVSEAGNILETRSVALGVASVSGRLENPRWKLLDGDVHSTMPPAILDNQTGLLLFTKSAVGVKGVYGVLTYDIADSQFKVAVMFSNPWNQLSYSNKYNFKVFSRTTPVDETMVRHMYYYAGAWKAEGYEERTEYGVLIYGTMSSNPHARLILWIDTSGLDIKLGPSRHAQCERKVVLERVHPHRLVLDEDEV